jgi:hypothetical protein
VRFPAVAATSAAFVWGFAPLPASADPEPAQAQAADHGNFGNGGRNRNIFSMESPTYNKGYQHTSTSTAGGATSIQNALCRHVKVCHITQNVILNQPGTATATQNKANIFTTPKTDILKPVYVSKPANINPDPLCQDPFLHLGPLGFGISVAASGI